MTQQLLSDNDLLDILYSNNSYSYHNLLVKTITHKKNIQEFRELTLLLFTQTEHLFTFLDRELETISMFLSSLPIFNKEIALLILINCPSVKEQFCLELIQYYGITYKDVFSIYGDDLFKLFPIDVIICLINDTKQSESDFREYLIEHIQETLSWELTQTIPFFQKSTEVCLIDSKYFVNHYDIAERYCYMMPKIIENNKKIGFKIKYTFRYINIYTQFGSPLEKHLYQEREQVFGVMNLFFKALTFINVKSAITLNHYVFFSEGLSKKITNYKPFWDKLEYSTSYYMINYRIDIFTQDEKLFMIKDLNLKESEQRELFGKIILKEGDVICE